MYWWSGWPMLGQLAVQSVGRSVSQSVVEVIPLQEQSARADVIKARSTWLPLTQDTSAVNGE